MPKSLLVFAVSLMPEMPNFGTFGGVAHPLRNLFNLNFCLFFNCVYALISKLNYKKYHEKKENLGISGYRTP